MPGLRRMTRECRRYAALRKPLSYLLRLTAEGACFRRTKKRPWRARQGCSAQKVLQQSDLGIYLQLQNTARSWLQIAEPRIAAL
jgi:hypothetical protein